jgi:hypothetical protein
LTSFTTPPCSIYVAASVKNQLAAAKLALELIDVGFKVTSRWIRHDFEGRVDASAALLKQKLGEHLDPAEEELVAAHDELMAEWGAKDLEDLEKVDTMVLLSTTPSSSGGYHVELGYAIASGKNILVVGDRPNVFFYTATVKFVQKLDGVVGWMRKQCRQT